MAKLCIAGKNDIASNGLAYVADEFAADVELFALPNGNDPGKHTWQKSLLLTARDLGVAVVERIEDLYDAEDVVFISLEFDRLIKVDRFKSDELFNIHFSKLPAYRGMYTSVLPILHGKDESGVTLHVIDSGIDTGDFIDRTEFAIEADDTARDLYFKYSAHALELFGRNVRSLVEGSYSSAPQDVTGASYYSKGSIDFGNVQIDLRKTAFEVKNQIRAFAFVEYQLPVVGGHRIVSADILSNRSDGALGDVVACEDDSMVVATIDYDVKLNFERSAS
jgi:methionyl-tRNA formyltransferase